MNDRELMQMALDALETVTAKMLECRDELAEYGGRPKSTGHKQRLWDSSHDVYVDNAIPAAEAIRTRLAQGDTETEQLSELVQILDKKLAQGEQEPVAWMCPDDPDRETAFSWQSGHCVDCGKQKVPVYTAPPQREWQGLTEEDQIEFCDALMCTPAEDWPEIIANVEKAVKEKNT